MGTREGTKMNEKGELVVGETNTGRSPISSVPVDVGIVPTPEGHIDVETVPIPESHIDTGTVPNPKSCVKTRTIRIHVSMLTEVQTP